MRNFCKKCSGTGHDPESRPEVRFDPFVDASGKTRKRHVTVKQGSGCLKCLGTGRVS